MCQFIFSIFFMKTVSSQFKKKRPAFFAGLLIRSVRHWPDALCPSSVWFVLILGERRYVWSESISCRSGSNIEGNILEFSHSFEAFSRQNRRLPQASAFEIMGSAARRSLLCWTTWSGTCRRICIVNAGSSSDGAASWNSRSHLWPPGSSVILFLRSLFNLFITDQIQ